MESRFQVDTLVEQIKHNCNISDAIYGGNLSLCNMLLRLRQLYYHEHNLRPWQPADNKQIISWIGERESLWDTLQNKNLEKIELDQKFYDPYDVDGINQNIEGAGYIYGAGNGLFGKPQFFLGKLIFQEIKNQVSIFHLNDEICTDLVPSFAMSQGNNIFIRRDSLIDFLFYKFRDRKSGSLLDHAFSQYGLNQTTLKNNYDELFLRVAERVENIIIYHELAEINLGNNSWKNLLMNIDDKKSEMYLRAIKDCMADLTSEGTLSILLQSHEEDLALFYSAFMNELYLHILPDLHDMLHSFRAHHDYSALENSRIQSLKYITSLYDEIMDEYDKAGVEAVKKIINRISSNNRS